MQKRFLQDPSIILLLLSNIFCIIYYQQHPENFGTIVWIYWFQSVIIGIFNFLDLLTLKNYNPSDVTINGKVAKSGGKGCVAFFFLFHYGMFHLVYAIFILVQQGIPDRRIVFITIIAFLMESLIIFRRKKLYEANHAVNPGVIMFLPYLRIVPMHLLIIIPVFFHISPSILFLVLKTFADLGFFLITQRMYRNVSMNVLEA